MTGGAKWYEKKTEARKENHLSYLFLVGFATSLKG
jgi:hypothetical protein